MLNWAGSLTLSGYLVVGKGWTANKKVQTFLLHSNWTIPWEGSFGMGSGTGHSKCTIPWEWFILSAGEIRNLLKHIHIKYVSLEPGFQPNEQFPGNGSVWVQSKTGHSNANHLYTGFGPWFGPDSIYILDSGLDSGLIQFIYWIRALIRALFNLYTGFVP